MNVNQERLIDLSNILLEVSNQLTTSGFSSTDIAGSLILTAANYTTFAIVTENNEIVTQKRLEQITEAFKDQMLILLRHHYPQNMSPELNQ